MRAMLLEKPAPAEQTPLRFAEVAEPQPGPGEIRVRIRCCGICHTDLHIVEGDLTLPKIPVVPGHQIVGVVDARGADVHDFKEGDRVGIPWLYSTEGTCDFCRNGAENLCEQARFTGYHVNGGYADVCVVRGDFAHRLPASFLDENAAPLLCAGVIGYRAYRLSGVKNGQRLGLYGFGASAHLVLQLALYRGCQVHVFTRSAVHRKSALELGAVWAGGAEDAPASPMDASIIFAPAGALVPLALRNLCKAGTLTLAGITMTQIPAFDYSLLYHERSIRSVANSTRQDCRDFLEIAAEIPIVTQVRMYSLAQANEALLDLKHSLIDGAAVLRID
jgi:propanol-preferring alcohol dehydrogenase